MPEPKNVLKMPSNVKSLDDISAAYIEAVMVIPKELEDIAAILEAQLVCFHAIADYMKKKGIEEKLFAPDDHPDLDDVMKISPEGDTDAGTKPE